MTSTLNLTIGSVIAIEYGTGELVEDLRDCMLCLADRLYPSFSLWKKASSTEASLLWRTRSNANLPVEEVLADGSYLARIYPTEKDKRKKHNDLVVRVIEYQLEGVEGAEPLYRLITTLMDCGKYPAQELAPSIRNAGKSK